MKITKLYVSKNEKKEKENQPDLRLAGITDDGKFIDIGAFWKAKSGKGYSGKLNDSTVIEYTENPNIPRFDRDSQGNPITTPKKVEILPEEIAF
jgi:uncharacterized protein (DUF736 family)